MKTKLLTLITLVLTGCIDTAIDSLNKVKKPAVVYSEYKPDVWYNSPQFTVKDADGKLISIKGDGIFQLVEKFNVGDTIK